MNFGRSRFRLAVGALLVCSVGAFAGLWTPDQPRAALEAHYLNSSSSTVEVLGAQLHVRDTGPRAAPAIIMIHGFASSLHTWESWAKSLEPNYRVIRFDLPGSGLSKPDPSGDYTDHRTVALLSALMDRLRVQKAILIGNSFGGRIAWRFAAAHPERVTKLVLVSPHGFADANFSYGQKPSVAPAFQMARYVLPKAVLRRFVQPMYGDAASLADDTVDRYYDLIRGPGVREALIARIEQTVLEDPEPLLRTIKAPVLLIWGQKDTVIPFSLAQRYLRDLSDARLEAFPTLGHLPQEEAPDLSLRPVAAFLAP